MAIAPPYERGRRPCPPPALDGHRPLPLVSCRLRRLHRPMHVGHDRVPRCAVADARETADTVTLRLATDDQALLAGQPGQFVMVDLPGFSPRRRSRSRAFRPDGLELTIRAAGPATARDLTRLQPGAQARPARTAGPRLADRARRWAATSSSSPAASASRRCGRSSTTMLREPRSHSAQSSSPTARGPRATGSSSPSWTPGAAAGIEVAEIVDRAGPEWLGRVGVVTQLLDRATVHGRQTVAFVCGPERMMQATVARSCASAASPRERIFVTLERHMDCGVGLCGHCQLGPFFVCRDGPVFSRRRARRPVRARGRLMTAQPDGRHARASASSSSPPATAAS